jgi:hypothetical protein
MIRLLLVLTSASAIAHPSRAVGFASHATWGAGIGLESCSHWLSSEQTIVEGVVWIEGYWTGINLMNRKNGLVGRTADVSGVIGKVRDVCTGEPSLPLEEAASEAYVALWHRKSH